MIEAPYFSVAGGTKSVPFSVQVFCNTTAVSMRYTLDGSDPSSTEGELIVNGAAVAVNSSLVLKAIAFDEENVSEIASVEYTLELAPPIVTMAGGRYFGPIGVYIIAPQYAASIVYTLDGTEPTSDNGTEAQSPVAIQIAKSKTLRAKAKLDSGELSEETQAEYIIQPEQLSPMLLPQPDGKDWQVWARELLVCLQSFQGNVSQSVGGRINYGMAGTAPPGAPAPGWPLWWGDDPWGWDISLPVAPDIVQIDTSMLVDAAITTSKLANLAVDVEKLAALAVTAEKVATGAISGDKFGYDPDTGELIVNSGAIGSAAIAAAAIGTAHIGNAAITSALIADAAIVSAKIDDLAVNNAHIANATLSTAKIENGFLNNFMAKHGKIGTAFINMANIWDLNIANEIKSIPYAESGGFPTQGFKILKNGNAFFQNIWARGDIEASSLKADTLMVSTANIHDAAITTAKIGDAQILSAKIASGEIKEANIGTAEISTLKVQGHAITVPMYAQLVSSVVFNNTTTDDWQDILVVSSAAVPDPMGGDLLVSFTASIYAGSGLSNSVDAYGTFRLLSDNVQAGIHTFGARVAGADIDYHLPLCFVFVIENVNSPPTLKVQAKRRINLGGAYRRFMVNIGSTLVAMVARR